jgi:hypothetical protein
MHFRKLGLALVFTAGVAGTAAQAQQANTISVPVTSPCNNIGDVRCGLFNFAATFPNFGQEV